MLVLQGRYRIADNRHREAREDFIAALVLKPDVEVALLAVKAAYLTGDQSQARKGLDLARQINARNRISRWTYAQDIQEWAAAVESMQSAPGRGDTDERSGGTAPVNGPGNAKEDGRRRVPTADHRDHPGT
jgi:hypothetical protein